MGTGSENVQSTLNNDQDREMMNSSCKDTMKMNDRREFSFIEQSTNENVGALNNYHSLQVMGTADGYIDGQAWGNNVNDTVSRLQGLNTSQMSKLQAVLYGPDGNALNPFIGDSYLFQNSNG